jgi:hypothetical protein
MVYDFKSGLSRVGSPSVILKKPVFERVIKFG